MAWSCDSNKSNNAPKQEKADTTSTAVVPTVSQSDSTQLPTAAKSLVLPNYSVKMFKKGDINQDNIEDLIVVLDTLGDDDMANRPLLLLKQDAKGTYTLAARNDKVVACKGCGGLMGDPLAGIAIKNGFFTIEEAGGSRERWTRYVTFKFDAAQNTWLLHRIDEEMVDTINEKNNTKKVKTTKNFGKITFDKYDSANIN